MCAAPIGSVVTGPARTGGGLAHVQDMTISPREVAPTVSRVQAQATRCAPGGVPALWFRRGSHEYVHAPNTISCNVIRYASLVMSGATACAVPAGVLPSIPRLYPPWPR